MAVTSSGMCTEPIDMAKLHASVARPEAGAVVTFDGRVRNHDHGHSVSALEYSAHPAASRIIAEVADDIAERFDLHALAVFHRTGSLRIGDVALAAAVSSSHRQDSFAAIAALVDAVKLRLPVWKKQYFADGSYEWSNCA
ncbi:MULTISPECIES: molybdenum cofactor biosynthesis protein MoaE [unclassified Corynebacterium]|uniref:molybdenum cofactor biosynthesis protein MoaE n=1 Tax=Corynebacterium TaxID=1716 RepID=UPI00351AB9AB